MNVNFIKLKDLPFTGVIDPIIIDETKYMIIAPPKTSIYDICTDTFSEQYTMKMNKCWKDFDYDDCRYDAFTASSNKKRIYIHEFYSEQLAEMDIATKEVSMVSNKISNGYKPKMITIDDITHFIEGEWERHIYHDAKKKEVKRCLRFNRFPFGNQYMIGLVHKQSNNCILAYHGSGTVYKGTLSKTISWEKLKSTDEYSKSPPDVNECIITNTSDANYIFFLNLNDNNNQQISIYDKFDDSLKTVQVNVACNSLNKACIMKDCPRNTLLISGWYRKNWNIKATVPTYVLGLIEKWHSMEFIHLFSSSLRYRDHYKVCINDILKARIVYG